jgi:hypothetical protein
MKKTMVVHPFIFLAIKKVNNPYYERFFPVPANERREPETELKIAVKLF